MINGKDIKKGTVTSKAVKDGTLKTKDLSSKAKSKLKGQQGPKGDTGAPGADGVVEPLSVSASNQAILTSNNPTEVLTLEGLTPGTTYVVNAKAQVGNGSADRVDCTISRNGTELDASSWDPWMRTSRARRCRSRRSSVEPARSSSWNARRSTAAAPPRPGDHRDPGRLSAAPGKHRPTSGREPPVLQAGGSRH